MGTVLLPPGGYPIAVNKYISYIHSPPSIDRFNPILSNVSRGRPVGVMTRPRAGQPGNRRSTSGGGRIFSAALPPDGS